MGKIKYLFISLIILCLLSSLVGCGTTGINTGTKTIDLTGYVTVEFSGYEGIGTAEIVYSTEALDSACENITVNKSAVKKALKEEEKEWGLDLYDDDDIENIIENMDAANYVEDILTNAELDITEDLSTGDIVTLTWNISASDIEEIETYFNVSLNYEDITYTVDGLEEVVSYNPFDDFEVVYSGISGDGELDGNSTSEYNSLLTYSCDTMDDLSNGDVITISVEADESLLEDYGIVLSQTEKEYTVEGLSEYITSASELTDEVLEKMQGAIKDEFDSTMAGWETLWTSVTVDVSVDEYEYIGNYFLVKKEGASGSCENRICLVYKVKTSIECTGYDTQTSEFYYCQYFDNIIKLSDGTLTLDYSDYDGYSSCNIKIHSKGMWSYSSFELLDTLFNKAVAVNVDDYTYENNINE